mgnify:CR=1 FL=1
MIKIPSSRELEDIVRQNSVNQNKFYDGIQAESFDKKAL